MYGTEVTEFLAPGASEGDVIMKHGAPDNIVYLGTPYFNPQTGEPIKIKPSKTVTFRAGKALKDYVPMPKKAGKK